MRRRWQWRRSPRFAWASLAAVVLGVGMMAWGVALLLGSEDRATPANGDESTTPGPVTVVESPTPTEPGVIATTTPTPSTGELLPQVAPALVISAPIAPPPQSVLYIEGRCESCAGFLHRVLTDGTGRSRVEDLPGPVALPGEYRRTYSASPDGSLIIASSCLAESCYEYFSADVRTHFFGSTDGGITWHSIDERPGIGLSRLGLGTALLGTIDPAAGETSERWTVLPSEIPVSAPPTATHSPWPLPGWGGPGWLSDSRDDVLSTAGELLLRLPLTPHDRLTAAVLLPGGGALVIWQPGYWDWPSSKAPPLPRLLTLVGPDSSVTWTRQLPADVSLILEGALSSDTALARVGHSSVNYQDWSPALIRLTDATVEPIDFVLTVGVHGPPTDFLAFMAGPFAKVVGAGDCLNVRAAPSLAGGVVGCYRDGVLLRRTGESREAEGMTWLAVATPGGAAGWAAANFLELLPGP